jgi:predicted NAD-dependent protein-ADP-ribosyltransferase YbiA (DUF1768 family)
MKTTEYWADEWAISKLEGLLNVKMVIFSKEKFEDGEVENVLQCGGEVAKHVRERGYFKPTYYIMAVHTGNHFRLIKYKDRRIFKFNEIPYDVKKLVVEKCMETSDSSEWNFITKFKKLKDGVKKKDDGKVEDEESDEDVPEGDDNSKKPEESKKESGKKLYTDDVVFQFYSGSSDKKKPGKGSGETIPPEREKDFKELQLKDNNGWRKVLSNFYKAPIQIDGKTWASVEHYYQGSKFKKERPDYYASFSLDDDSSKINQEPALAKKAGSGKKGQPPADSDFFGKDGRASKEMKRAQLEKYKTNEHARKILLLTKDAKLVHYLGRGSGTVVFTETMEIRQELKNKE